MSPPSLRPWFSSRWSQGHGLVRCSSSSTSSSTLTPQTFFLWTRKKRFLSFVFFCAALSQLRFALTAVRFSRSLTITSLRRRWNTKVWFFSGVLLIFYYELIVFFWFCSQILYLFSSFFVCVSFAVIYFFGYSNLLLSFRFLTILRKRLDKFHYYTEWNCNSLFLICLFVFFSVFFWDADYSAWV